MVNHFITGSLNGERFYHWSIEVDVSFTGSLNGERFYHWIIGC